MCIFFLATIKSIEITHKDSNMCLRTCVCVWLHGWRPMEDSGVTATRLMTTDTSWWICQESGDEKNRQGRVVNERADKKKWERRKCDFAFVHVCMPGNGDRFMPNRLSSEGDRCVSLNWVIELWARATDWAEGRSWSARCFSSARAHGQMHWERVCSSDAVNYRSLI